MKKALIVALVLLIGVGAVLFMSSRRDGPLSNTVGNWFAAENAENTAPEPTTSSSAFTPNDAPVGDPKLSYFNVEVFGSYPYMVWFEAKGRLAGTVWHCGINPDTGDLIPADCRGFRAFDSTSLNRANIGVDSKGLYYVGADAAGNIKLVRPTGPSSGAITDIAAVSDTRRRAYYPSLLPNSSKQYLAWILNSNVAAAGADSRNSWVELQYIDLADPSNVRSIERQDRPARGFAPMDAAFFRWFENRAAISYGSKSGQGVDMKIFDAGAGVSAFVTNDGNTKADPYPWVFNNLEIVMPGIDVAAYAHIYTRPLGSTGLFKVAETITLPKETELAKPVLAQSFQPIVWKGKAYAAYQVNDGSGGVSSFMQIFTKPGEIWLTTVLQDEQKQWRISASNNLVKAEPEPFVGNDNVWVFYSAAPAGASNPGSTIWQLRRAATPISI